MMGFAFAHESDEQFGQKVMSAGRWLMWGFGKELRSGGKFTMRDYCNISRRTWNLFIRESFLDQLMELRVALRGRGKPTRKDMHILLDCLRQLDDFLQRGLDSSLDPDSSALAISPPNGVHVGTFDTAIAHLIVLSKYDGCPRLPKTYRALRDLLNEKLTGKPKCARRKKAPIVIMNNEGGNNSPKLKNTSSSEKPSYGQKFRVVK